ncbi:dihydrolipoyllysine-residue succinyltransferase [Buchnera aphidicola]|uniref:dihydrolipoyllysine-residue succinyltransferase n=1 Tax=Buchnera aphidicola TaxID=9 RepID=UPI0020928384|nr:dihydrolipoyllysine-residue succinyltransferase [Buchnera aphidicola]USS94328.1 dihydrolipoyllysine-residue succinyltransferase [Buchnera aphidicola (Sipha maydis)]WII23487.1 dihydrolipoyllysine-residue succinyltransferase [Buchnera aphidicola (Sipha maydis)]
MNKKKIRIPELPESVYHATIIKWHKNIGDYINKNDLLIDLETDKIMIEVPSLTNGILNKILKNAGDLVKSNDIIGYIKKENTEKFVQKNKEKKYFSPSLRRKKNISLYQTKNLKTEVSKKIDNSQQKTKKKKTIKFSDNKLKNSKNLKIKKIINMSSLRKKISERLVKSKNETAMLTTFNEVNMQSIIKIRKKFGHDFEKKYQVKLGFMSFFVKSVIYAIKKYPIINSSIIKDKIFFYKNININIAISTDRGLVAPVLFNANKMDMFEIEKKIKFYILQSHENKLTIDDLENGTFTITNGGVFGSLMSTPIINPPQSAILGIHAINNRPIVKKDKIISAPMMYISLSYDHRLIDGKDSVGFLKCIKFTLENFINVILKV